MRWGLLMSEVTGMSTPRDERLLSEDDLEWDDDAPVVDVDEDEWAEGEDPYADDPGNADRLPPDGTQDPEVTG